MRTALILLMAVAVLAPAPASACVADPVLSTVVVASAPMMTCHWIFQPGAPMFDTLLIDVTLRDAAGVILPGCPVTATFIPVAGNATACPLVATQVRTTGPTGMVRFVFEDLRGCGQFNIDIYDVTGALLRSVGPFNSTSSDLTSDGLVNIFDLAVFASGLPPGYSACVDYNCDGFVDVFDLAVWAGGLGGIC